MQKIFIVVLSVVLFACHADEKKEANTTPPSADPLPYSASYSSKFEMGDAKNASAVLMAWKAWDDGDLMASRKLFSDTMRFYLRDGSTMTGSTDSSLKSAQQFRSNYATVKSTVDAYLPVRSTDRDQDWVLIWGTEVSTDKTGKVDTVHLQETWRFNKDGKIDLLYQYGQAPAVPAQK